MSEQKTIKLKFNNKETEVQAFDTYQELFDFFCKNFTIDDDKKKNLSLFYYDEDGDQISFQQDNDYKIFIGDEDQNQKVIEGEITENDNQDNSMEKQDQEQDPMKSGTIFKKNVKEQTLDLGLKNIDSASLANSLYSIDSISSAMVFKKGNEDFAKNINQLNNKVKTTLEDTIKENEIEKMKKEMEELIKKHQEELKKKEEENERKYKEALAQKENEMKKQMEEKERKLNEDRLKKEKEMKEKYEFEMKSNIQLKEKEIEEMKSKIELENKKKWKKFKKKKKKIKKN